MRIIITIWPNNVKSFGMSLTISPVTHTADVDVKSASIKEHPLVLENGSIRRIAPTSIKDMNPSTRICEGDSFIFIEVNFKQF